MKYNKKYYNNLYIFIALIGLISLYTPTASDEGVYYNQGILYNIPPLLRAATYGDVTVFKKLLHDGVSIDSEDRDGNTSLALIVMNMNYSHNRKMLDLVLRLHPHMRVKSYDGLMAIHMASRIDASLPDVLHTTIAKLVEFGARMDDKDNKGYTILDRIVERYERQGTEAVLAKLGPLMTDQMVNDSIRIATERSFLDPLNFALQKGRRTIKEMDPIKPDAYLKFNGLHCAVMLSDVSQVTEWLAQKKVQINQPTADEYALQPLHLAVLQQDVAMVKLLVDNGANVNGVDSDGNTPLHLTANLPTFDHALHIALYLLQHGAHNNAATKEGNTLLHLCVFYGNWQLIQELNKKHDFDERIRNNERETPIDMINRLNRKIFLQFM